MIKIAIGWPSESTLAHQGSYNNNSPPSTAYCANKPSDIISCRHHGIILTFIDHLCEKTVKSWGCQLWGRSSDLKKQLTLERGSSLLTWNICIGSRAIMPVK